MRIRLIGLVVFILIIIGSSAFAQSPQISSGLTWLYSDQTPTGNWPEVKTSDYYSTATSLDAVYSLDPSSSAYSTALTWLGTQLVSPTDYISRQVIALARSGQDTSGYVSSLLLYRNSDGGWGGETDYLDTVIDTALALQALKAANYSDTTLIGQSLGYLTSNQNADGGWGFVGGDDSNTYVTAIVQRTLAAYNTVFINQTAITNASAYISTKQNSDGGFGSSPSNIYETALSIISLIESGQGTTVSLQNAINYIITSQSSNGSWNDDPYSTALALQALAAVRPNLSISSTNISFSNIQPQEKENITITAIVSNTGYENASSFLVRFYLGDPASGGTQLGVDQLVSSLGTNASIQSSVTASFTGTGSKSIYVSVDPTNQISEISKADNIASNKIWVATAPDLAIFSEDLVLSSTTPSTNTAFTLSYKVYNVGESTAGAFTVGLYDGNPSSGGTQLQTANVSGLDGGAMRSGSFGVTLATIGTHTLYLTADPSNVISEISRTNNTGTATVNVGGSQQYPDLVASQVGFNPTRPKKGDTVQVTALVQNTGYDASSFTAELFDNDPNAGGTLIYSTTLALATGATQSFTTNWAIPAGIHDVYLIVDRLNAVTESNETNNQTSSRIMTDMVDIDITATDLSFSPSHPVSGDSVVLSMAMHNTGIKDTGPFTFAVYDGDPASGGTLLQTYSIANLTSDGTTTIPYTFTATPWTYRFYAVVDTQNVVTELYETNNTAIRSLKVKSAGETLGPDLVPIDIDLSSMTTNSLTLSVSGSAKVTFQNKGDDKITSYFSVMMFEDVDNDGKYTQGIDNVLSTATNTTAIWPEGVGSVTLNLSGSVSFLHSPLYAFVDSGDAIYEQNEDNNLLRSGSDCENKPSSAIQTISKWTWDPSTTPIGPGFAAPPIVINLIDTNGDGVINELDVPAIVYGDSTNINANGGVRIFALRGDTGQTIFSKVTTGHGISDSLVFAAGDIDNDGRNEIITTRNFSQTPYGEGLIAFDNAGTVKWDNYATVSANPGAMIHSSYPVIADIDHDGKPEIIMGATVFNNDGTLKWKHDEAAYGDLRYPAVIADLDLDGKMEVLVSHTAYNSDGTTKWNMSNFSAYGMNAVAHFTDDAYPEIVHIQSGTAPSAAIYLFDHTGKVKWGPVYFSNLEPAASPALYYALPPIVADFDGDGEAEIGIRGYSKFFILDKNGTVKQTITPPSCFVNKPSSYYVSNPTVFDLNGDGVPEIIFNDNGYLSIFSGKDGTLEYKELVEASNYFCSSNYAVIDNHRVIVADVNADGHAEIVLYDSYPDGKTGHRIHVFGSKNNDWVNTRKVWNQQMNNHVTNVNDNGSIPQYESPSWLLNNTYNCQAAIGANPNPYLTPNLTASYLRADQSGSSVNLAIRIGNGGATQASTGIPVVFYDGNPASGGTVIATTSTTQTLQPGQYQDISISWSSATLGLHHVYVVVNSGTGSVSECETDDNQAQADVTIQTEYADLKIGSEDITLPSGHYYEGTPMTIAVNVKNIGALSTSNVLVRMYYGNPASGGTQIGTDQTISSISAGGSSLLTFSYDTLGHSGTNIIYFVADPLNTIAEASETNNSASVSFSIEAPVQPDLSISASDIQLSSSSPQEGDKITVSATIHNLGASTGNIPVRVYLGDPSNGGVIVSEQTIYPVLAFNSSTTIQATVDTLGYSGQRSVYVVIDPANSIAESNENNNSASQSFTVQSASLTTSLSLDKTSYQASDTVTAALNIVNQSSNARYLSLGIIVQDSAGNSVATVASADSVAINPNSTNAMSKTWSPGTTLAGNYTLVASLTEGTKVVSKASAAFIISADNKIEAKATVDKVSYNPNETATVTSTITSKSANYIYENLTAAIAISSGTGSSMYTGSKTVSSLMPGAYYSFKTYWNTTSYASGTYPVTLTLKDSTGAVVATGTQNLVISSTIKPSAVLSGQVAVDKQNLLSGETVSISYSVKNIGNADLSGVTLSALTVHVVNETVYDTLSEQTAIAMGKTYANTKTLDTTKYTAMDYLVVLRASINGTEETIGGTYFRVEGAPTTPSLASPAEGSDVTTLTPTLTVNNASDPNDDTITYGFELYSDSGLMSFVSSTAMITEGTGTTGWTVPIELAENQTYYWRARAYDANLYGPWMATASFRVNVQNDPPNAPVPTSPTNASFVSVLTPLLTVMNAIDPDSASLTYNFDLALDPDFTQIVTSTTGVTSGSGTTFWQVPQQLIENTWYYWRAQADDWLVTGPWSTTASFFVNTTNEAPTAPAIINPLNNSIVPTLSTAITASNSADPDSTLLTYSFEADTTTTFDTSSVIRSNAVSQGDQTTSWIISNLQDNTQYYVRAKASDGTAYSPWSPVIGFFVNTVNDPPTVPVLNNPSDKGAVSTFTPALSIRNSTDPDKDSLTYDFEVYADQVLASLVTSTTGVAETSGTTGWTVLVSLTENKTYYWRARAFDGKVASSWMPAASFTVNTANDAPSAPTIYSPLDSSTIATLLLTLSVQNATDPDSSSLTYDFEVYANNVLVASKTSIPGDASGVTSVTLTTSLTDNTVYQWRARAYDGDRYGPWTAMATFTTHVATQTGITVDLEIEPATLNKKSEGNWVMAEIELPHGYKAEDVDISSIRLEGTVRAESTPTENGKHHEEHGCDKDSSSHDHAELKVKFKRSSVIAVLPTGDKVTVHVTGKVGTTNFEGVDVIKVLACNDRDNH